MQRIIFHFRLPLRASFDAVRPQRRKTPQTIARVGVSDRSVEIFGCSLAPIVTAGAVYEVLFRGRSTSSEKSENEI